MADELKACPDCAETVKAAAKVCRFCGHKFAQPNWLDRAGAAATEAAQKEAERQRAIHRLKYEQEEIEQQKGYLQTHPGILIPCPACMKSMPMNSFKCPHCSKAFTNNEIKKNISEKGNRNLLVCVSLVTVLFCGLIYLSLRPASSPSIELPAHSVEESSLSPKEGRRVQVQTAQDIGRGECVALIEAYRSVGSPDGQVSVHKPSAKLGGGMQPWCVENFDGEGVRFNDFMF